MTLWLLAMGRRGAEMAEDLIQAAMIGVFPYLTGSLCLVGVPEEEKKALETLLKDYDRVRGCLNRKSGVFRGDFTLASWPEKAMEKSLQERCRDGKDQMLLRALFPAERTLRRDLNLMENAECAWQDLMKDPGDTGRLEALCPPGENVQVLCAGSLCDAFTSAGCAALLPFLAQRHPVSAILEGPVFGKDPEGEVYCGLQGLPEALASLYLTGLPADLRLEGSGRSLMDLVFLSCMGHFLLGGEGRFVFAAEEKNPDYDLMGDLSDVWRQQEKRWIRSSGILLGDLGPTLLEQLASSSLLEAARGGLWQVLYGALRKDSLRRREEHEALESLMRLMQGHAAWLDRVTEKIPMILLASDSVAEAREKARLHYLRYLDAVGFLALMKHDTEQCGIFEGETIHRDNNQETEEEENRARIEKMEEDVENLRMEQEELNRLVGGRVLHSMLSGILLERKREVEDLGRQGEEAERRINAAAEKATPEEMPRVDAARSRLNRLRRHMVLLEGKRAMAQADAERVRSDAVRTQPPEAGRGVRLMDVWVPRACLKTLERMENGEKRERRRLFQEMDGQWPEMEMGRFLQETRGIRRSAESQAQGMALLLSLLMEEGEVGHG